MARKDIQNVWGMASMLFLGWRVHIRYPTSQKSALTIRLKHISRCDEREITVPSCFILFHCIEKDSRCLVSGSRRKKMKVNLSVCKALPWRTILICSDNVHVSHDFIRAYESTLSDDCLSTVMCWGLWIMQVFICLMCVLTSYHSSFLIKMPGRIEYMPHEASLIIHIISSKRYYNT